MAWPKVHWCAVRNCGGEGERVIHWLASSAGSCEVCERHYRLYGRKFKHLITKAPLPLPDQRFADTASAEPVEELAQLEL